MSEQLKIHRHDISLVIFKFSNDLTSNVFYETFIDPLEWNSLRKVDLWNRVEGSLFSLNNIYRILSFLGFSMSLLFRRRYNFCIVNQIDANYYRLLYNLCRYKTIISLDEGNAVLRFIEERNSRLQATPFSLPLPQKITFFSSYDIHVFPPDTLIECTNEFSKKIIKAKEIDFNTVLFVGSPFVEDNMMDQHHYFSYLLKVRNHYKDCEIRYISHRREISSNLKIIHEQLGFTVISLQQPVELYFLRLTKTPITISGFYSAAVYNLKKMVPNGLGYFEVFYIDPKLINKDTPELIRNIYSHFSNVGIKIIE